MRVAVARWKDVNHTAFAEELFRALAINGKSAIHDEEDYREFSFDKNAGDDETRAVAAAIVKFAPTLVVSSVNDDMVARIEEAWPASSTRRPHYQTHAGLDDDLLRFIGTSADRRARVAGFTSVSGTLPNARFVVHYNETFDDRITRTLAPNSSYDALYVIAYGAYALGGRSATGDALAQAIERLQPPGPQVDVGPTGIFEASGALARGQHIDLNGATGSLDFDPQDGGRARRSRGPLRRD